MSARGFIRRRPRRWTVRLRLTLLQGALILASGMAVIGIAYALALTNVPKHFTQGPSDIPTQGVHGGPLTQQPPGKSTTAAQHAADLEQFLIVSGIALVVVALLSLGVGWLVAGRILHPLRTMISRTRRIFEDNLHERLPVQGPQDELTEMGDTINGLLARLEAAFDAQRRFVANASHELRTPITYEQATLEVALADPAATTDLLRATCQEVLASSRQQARLIDALLTLARSQRGLDHREVFDLAAVTAGVVRSARKRLNGTRTPDLKVDLREAPVAGDPRIIERLVVNLVDNAMRYNVPGGWVEICVRYGQGGAVLTVENSGPPTPADQIDRLLQPFQRLAGRSKQGTPEGLGLGLSIVDAIVKAHSARLAARPGREGGLYIEIVFPAVPARRHVTRIT
jgi:signal transduction histidine kinase